LEVCNPNYDVDERTNSHHEKAAAYGEVQRSLEFHVRVCAVRKRAVGKVACREVVIG